MSTPIPPFMVTAVIDELDAKEDPFLLDHMQDEAERALVHGGRQRHNVDVREDDVWVYRARDPRTRVHLITVWWAPQPDRPDGCVIEGGPHDGYVFAMSRQLEVGHPVHRLTLPILPAHGADLELLEILGEKPPELRVPDGAPASIGLVSTDYHCVGIDPATTRWVYVPGTCSTFP